MFGLVALLTGKIRMFAFQWVSCLPVVECLLGWLPVNQDEVLAVMFRMTADTVLAGTRGAEDGGVEAAMAGESRRDFRMAFQTSIDRRPGRQLMAGCALQRTADGCVGPGERTRRDLCPRPNDHRQLDDGNRSQNW